MKKQYYSLEPILNKTDLNKKKPSIYMITSNRSAGKTTAVLKHMLEHFKETGRKCALIYRYKYELNACHEIFSDILRMYPEYGQELKSYSHASGLFYEIMLDNQSFGYAMALSNPDSLKKYSPVFSEVDILLFDEFQTESGQYLNNEPQKLQSVLLSIARGGGQQSRPIELFLLGNMVSLMNPYFIEFDIHKRLKNDTKFLRGDGWIAEFGFNESASQEIQSNSLFSAFKNSDYMNYSTENIYLHDTSIFVDKPTGKSKYICTIVHDGVSFGVREYYERGIVYVSRKHDQTCKNVITFKASDHNQNTIMLNHYSFLWKNIKDAYQQGYLRFEDLKTKNAIFDILAIDLYK